MLDPNHPAFAGKNMEQVMVVRENRSDVANRAWVTRRLNMQTLDKALPQIEKALKDMASTVNQKPYELVAQFNRYYNSLTAQQKRNPWNAFALFFGNVCRAKYENNS